MTTPETPSPSPAAVPFVLPPAPARIVTSAVESSQGKHVVVDVHTDSGVFRFQLDAERAANLGDALTKISRMVASGLTVVENGKH
ncbi:MAG: hypothetical protein ACRDUW_05000 [Pseudonocardiaceae bacterium]